MALIRAAWAALVIGLSLAAAAVFLSGGSQADPRTPRALPGLPAPFLGTAVVGSGGLTVAIDAYGDVVDLRARGPAGEPLIAAEAKRQSAGTVPAGSGIVPRVSIAGGAPLPLWRADSVRQRYVPGTNVLRTVARIGSTKVVITDAAGKTLVRKIEVSAPRRKRIVLLCSSGCRQDTGEPTIRTEVHADRRWLARARPLGPGAPRWARRMYERSLLVLRALTDRRTGAVAAGARDGWAYVWPRDAAAVAMALAASGYRRDAHRIAHFLLHLDLDAAARFRGTGVPVDGRDAEGDAAGWVAAAARATGLRAPHARAWRGRADYQEGDPGDYLANAIASGATPPVGGPETSLYGTESAHRHSPSGDGPETSLYGTESAHRHGLVLVREVGDPGSGIDSAAAWAVRPFPHPALFPLVRRSLRRLVARAGRFGIVPSQNWPGTDPWTAPTAWTAWSLAALGERREALRLMADLRRAATPAGLLPERVGARSGLPRSTTPLAWAHAFAILAIRELWPPG